MSLETFIPAVWSARLLENLHKAHVYGQPDVVNRDYEGDIAAFGDTVKIHTIGAVTVSDYTKNTDITSPQALTDAELMLVIDQSKYFNFQIDDVDVAQQRPKVMDGAMREAAYALADVADLLIAGKYTDVDSANTIGSDSSSTTITTAADAYNNLVSLGVLLDQANIPSQQRWVVVPPWYEAKLRAAGGDFLHATAMGDQMLRNGEVGEAAGFTVLKSNNVHNVAADKYKIIAGYPGAISFAEQISKVEAYTPEKRFADAVKGLHLYGCKVVRPSGIAVLTATKG